MGIFDTFKKSVGNLFKLKGRAPRSEFWIFSLFIGVPGSVIFYALNSALEFGGLQIKTALFISTVVFFVPFFGITTRRLNDRNYNGKILTSIYFAVVGFSQYFELFHPTVLYASVEMYLIYSLSVTVMICFFLYQFVRRGNKGPNKYGADPTPPKKKHPPSELQAVKPPFDRDGM